MDCKVPGLRFAKTPFVDASYQEKPFLLSSQLDPCLKCALSKAEELLGMGKVLCGALLSSIRPLYTLSPVQKRSISASGLLKEKLRGGNKLPKMKEIQQQNLEEHLES